MIRCMELKNTLDQMNLEDCGLVNIEDDEARVFHVGDFEYEYVVDPNIGSKSSEQYDAAYRDLSKKHHMQLYFHDTDETIAHRV
ncbi:hypothetical protein PAHAL_9G319300 [Panicum hallii]|uniref:Uncharacterized protein n=1 Tax=Panicum hallii TaxID=206008 RepID=A0A2T8I358_9POAL|nr:hypothetical protein PAHAL_9G319300 [Panicum hallii]